MPLPGTTSIRTLIHRRGLIAAAAAGLALAMPAAAHAQVTSSSWAGYAASSSTYTSVTATWVQPKITCSGGASSSASFWVGLDGLSSDTVEQVGTEADCVSGSAVYVGWYELYPENPVTLTQKLSPGDSVTATVSATTGDVFTLTLEDTTAGWTNSSKHTFTEASRASAEVAAEIPGDGSTLSPGNGSVTYTKAEVDGASLGAASPTEYNSSTTTCGPLVDGTQFTCTW
jgi:hypothetical protein